MQSNYIPIIASELENAKSIAKPNTDKFSLHDVKLCSHHHQTLQIYFKNLFSLPRRHHYK